MEVTAPLTTRAFTVSPEHVYIVPGSLVQVDNMPSIQSQASMGTCFACSAAAILQEYACNFDPIIINLGIRCDDPSFPKNLIVSQLDMVAWADTNRNDDRSKEGAIQPGYPSNHTNIKLYEDRTDYSSGNNALRNITRSSYPRFIPESCFPTSNILNLYGDGGTFSASTNQLVTFERAYHNAKAFYEKYRNRNQILGDLCPECLTQLNRDFGTSFDKSVITSALTQATYPEFLYALLFSECKRIKFSERPKFREAPEGIETFPRAELLEKIVNVLNRKRPVQVNDLCVRTTSAKQASAGGAVKGPTCTGYHTTVVTGYRTACSSAGMSDCIRQFHIHNCWGNSWQLQSNGGWVNASPFIDSIDFGEERISQGQLTWLEPPTSYR